MGKVFNNINVVKEDGIILGNVEILDGRFLSLNSKKKGEDYSSCIMIPGFIEQHSHGAIGLDFTTLKNKEEAETLLKFYISHGVTSILPTLLTEKDEVIFKQLELLYEVSKTNPIIKGIHIEGPFLSKKYKGAQLEEYFQTPSIKKVDEYIKKSHGLFKLMTIAPELENAIEVIKYLVKKGIKVSLGHSDATFEESSNAIEAGATCITHMMNAMRGLHQHEPSIATAALYFDEVYNEVIMDGVHIHPEMVEFIRKLKTTDKVIGVSDSLMAAGLKDGEYKIGNTPIVVKDGDCLIKETGVRAGSTLNMESCFKNFKKFTSLGDVDASKVTSLNSAKMLGIDGDFGSIKVNKIADFVIFDKEYNIKEVYINGEQVYAK